MKKKWVLAIIILVGCSLAFFVYFRFAKTGADSSTRLKVTTTIPLLKNIVAEIGKDTVTVDSIISGPSCNHEYEPSSGDFRRIHQSSLLVKAGMGFDLWADRLLGDAGDGNIKIIDASRGAVAIANEAHSHEEENHEAESASEETSHESEHHHHLQNPHYWGNPENVKIMAENIYHALSESRPAKKDYFLKNYQAYITRLESTVKKLKQEVGKLKNKEIISYSAAFPYFYQYFGFANLATVETTCEQEVSPKHLAEVVELIKKEKIKVVVGEAVYPNLPENLVKETNSKLVLLWPATNDSENYLKTLTDNVEKMVSALND